MKTMIVHQCLQCGNGWNEDDLIVLENGDVFCPGEDCLGMEFRVIEVTVCSSCNHVTMAEDWKDKTCPVCSAKY